MKGSVLIVGATSAIGTAMAHRLAAAGCDLILASRDRDELERHACDLAIRFGVRAHAVVFDARDFASHDGFVERARTHAAGELAGLFIAQGIMPEREEIADSPDLAQATIETNFSAAVSLVERLGPGFESRGSGWICAVSSVAGDRGRPSNYLYGATKAALSTYLEGLRVRLGRSGIRVVDVRPGFVDTGLTWGRPGLFLVASPDRVARDAWRGIRRNRGVVYTPGFWRWIMTAIRWIPEPIFRKLDL